MYKKIIRTNLIFTAMFVSLFINLIPFDANASWMSSYYKDNPTSIEDLKSEWGEPANVVQKKDGVIKMIYGPKITDIGYTCFFIKDNMVIDKGVTDSLEKPTTASNKKAHAFNSWMAKHYRKNPMSVDKLKEKYGEPLRSQDYDDGVQKLTFGPKIADIGYTTFFIQNGMVVDKGVSDN